MIEPMGAGPIIVCGAAEPHSDSGFNLWAWAQATMAAPEERPQEERPQ